ncbi:MAG TPA: hypothetical protein VNV62_30015 [Trebonia sp.]|nr:hypothetical protein [Trebonia sp.]
MNVTVDPLVQPSLVIVAWCVRGVALIVDSYVPNSVTSSVLPS